MNASFRGGLLVGSIAGVFVTAVAAMLLRPKPEPIPDAPSSATTALLEASKALKDENRRLTDRIAELEKPRPPAPPSPKEEAKPAPEKEEAPDLKNLFAKVTESGGQAGIPELIVAVKKLGKAGIDFLAGVLRTSTVSMERLLAAAILEQTGDAAAVEPLALALKTDKDDIVRRMAARAIGVLAKPAGEDPLREAISVDKDWGVRVNASYGLAKLGKEDGLRLLREAYESAETPSEYRLPILGGLADVAAPSTAPLFRRILAETKDASYMLVSISALEKMKDAESLPALQRVQDSTHPENGQAGRREGDRGDPEVILTLRRRP